MGERLLDYIIAGFWKALEMIFSGDAELWGIVGLSLRVSGSAIVIAALMIIPLFTFIGLKSFRGERILSRVLNALMSMPSVVVGLLVSVCLSRRGPLGHLQLMYTPTAMIIAQVILVSPLIACLTYEMVKHRGRDIQKLGQTLGASKLQSTFMVISELKSELFIYTVNGFSRAISEVGAVMMVGGNIKGDTRVITTTISMLNSMGDYAMAFALGMILIVISLVINSILYTYKEKRADV